MSQKPSSGYYYIQERQRCFDNQNIGKLFYRSNLEMFQMEYFDKDFSISIWGQVPLNVPSKYRIPYTSSLDKSEHLYYPDFVFRDRYKDPNTIHILELKADTLIEASYNVEPLINQIHTGKISVSKLKNEQKTHIEIRDKRRAMEAFVDDFNKTSENVKYRYHLTYHYDRNNFKEPSNQHELYLEIRQRLLEYQFTTQKQILDYVNTFELFSDLSRQLFEYYLKQCFERLYFTREFMESSFAHAKDLPRLEAEAEAKAIIEQERQREIARKLERENREKKNVEFEERKQKQADKERQLKQAEEDEKERVRKQEAEARRIESFNNYKSTSIKSYKKKDYFAELKEKFGVKPLTPEQHIKKLQEDVKQLKERLE
jgi:hypothetical protein